MVGRGGALPRSTTCRGGWGVGGVWVSGVGRSGMGSWEGWSATSLQHPQHCPAQHSTAHQPALQPAELAPAVPQAPGRSQPPASSTGPAGPEAVQTQPPASSTGPAAARPPWQQPAGPEAGLGPDLCAASEAVPDGMADEVDALLGGEPRHTRHQWGVCWGGDVWGVGWGVRLGWGERGRPSGR